MARAVLGVELTKAQNWEEILGGPKVPANYKDPEKIEAKKQEWYEKAEAEYKQYPAAVEVGKFTLIVGSEITNGMGPTDLIERMQRLDMDTTPSLVVGFNAPVAVKSAALKHLAAGFKVPAFCWRAGSFTARLGEDSMVLDPLQELQSGFGTNLDRETVLRLFGKPDPADLPADKAAQTAKVFAERMMLI